MSSSVEAADYEDIFVAHSIEEQTVDLRDPNELHDNRRSKHTGAVTDPSGDRIVVVLRSG
jgi:hypothetical protein